MKSSSYLSIQWDQLGEKAVAKAVKCAKNTVQYWLNRWKESKDLSDMKRPGRPRATTEKVDQRIYKLAGSDNIATTGDMQSVLKRQNIGICQETIRRRLKEAGPSSAYQYQNHFDRKSSI